MKSGGTGGSGPGAGPAARQSTVQAEQCELHPSSIPSQAGSWLSFSSSSVHTGRISTETACKVTFFKAPACGAVCCPNIGAVPCFPEQDTWEFLSCLYEQRAPCCWHSAGQEGALHFALPCAEGRATPSRAGTCVLAAGALHLGCLG